MIRAAAFLTVGVTLAIGFVSGDGLCMSNPAGHVERIAVPSQAQDCSFRLCLANAGVGALTYCPKPFHQSLAPLLSHGSGLTMNENHDPHLSLAPRNQGAPTYLCNISN